VTKSLEGPSNDALMDADIVSVCSYDQFHFEQIKILWEAGKHVVVEKPPCLRQDHLEQLVQMVESKPDQYFMCNLPLPYALPFAELAEVDYGEVYAVEASYNWGRVEKLREGWRRDCPGYHIALGAGLHVVDLAIWAVQREVRDGASYGNNFNVHGLDSPDTIMCVLEFVGGAVGTVSINCGSSDDHSHSLIVSGTKTRTVTHNTGEIDKTVAIKKFIETIREGKQWSNLRLYHAMGVCFSMMASQKHDG